MVFGDSLSAAYGLDEEQGWAYLLQDRLSDSGDEREVINLSVSGETTGGGWARLPDALEVYRPSVVVLELGANDGLRGLSVKRMQRNLTNMVSAAQDSGAQVLMLGMRLPPSYGKRYVEAFEAVFPRVSETQNVELMPFFWSQSPCATSSSKTTGCIPLLRRNPFYWMKSGVSLSRCSR